MSAAASLRLRLRSRLRSLLLGVLLLAAGYGLAAISLRSGIGPHDEGLMLVWGQRIADGQWPYRDFWSNYGPGQPLLQALIGDSLLTWRIVRAATGALAALLVFVLVRRVEGGTVGYYALAAWAAAALALAWPLTPGPNGSALALALAALVAAQRTATVAGALAGAAALMRPEIGVAALAAVLVIASGPALKQRPLLRATAAAAAVATLGYGPFLIASPAAIGEQIGGFQTIQSLQRLPLVGQIESADPNKLLEALIAPLLLTATALWVLVVVVGRERRLLALLPLIIVSALYLLARADEFHSGPLAVIAATGAGLLGAGGNGSYRRRQMAILVSSALLALLIVYGADRVIGAAMLAADADSEPIGLPTSGRITAPAAEGAALRALAADVNARSAPGSPLLVLPPRTDRVRVGAPLLYILLDRRNPTGYDVMQPGLVTTAAVQRKMIAAARAADTRLVIRWRAPLAAATEPNGSSRSSGVRLLDRWVARTFKPVALHGDYQLLARRR